MVKEFSDAHEQVALLSRLIEQSTALADALGLDGTAAELRRIRLDTSVTAAGDPGGTPRGL